MMSTLRIKICCIASISEAHAAIRAGADAVGLVGSMPSGPGIIDDDVACDIANAVPPPIATFSLTSATRGEEIVDHLKRCQANTVQVVQHIDPAEWDVVTREMPHIRRVQVIHVEDAASAALLRAYEERVHAFLFDSGRPKAAVAELGGTGRTHDWSISARMIEQTQRPVFLAGGLTPENVASAIKTVQPYGVDLCTSVRTDDALDLFKLKRFIRAARNA